MDAWITRGLEEGVQFVLSVLWIIVILYGLKSAPKGGKSLLDLLAKLNGTIEDNTELLTYTKDLHEKMEETDRNRHDVVVDKLDIAVTEIRELREMHEELDGKTTLKLERIERALTAEIDGRQKGD